MSASINATFKKLFDRDPTDAEIRDIYRFQEALGLSHDDAIWGFYLMLKDNASTLTQGREALLAEVRAASETAKSLATVKLDELTAQAVVNIQDRVSEGVKVAAGSAIADSQAMKRSVSLAGVLALVICSLFLGGAIQSALDAPKAVGVGVMDSLLFAFIDYMSRSGAGYFYISLALGVLLLHDMRHRSIRSFGGFVVSMVLICFGLWPLLSAVASVIR